MDRQVEVSQPLPWMYRQVGVPGRERLHGLLVELHAAVQAVEVHLVQVAQGGIRMGMAVDEARHHGICRPGRRSLVPAPT